MHTRRCSVLPSLDDAGNPRVLRRVTTDLRRQLVLADALIEFVGGRPLHADVVVNGCAIDAVAPLADGCRYVDALVEIDDGEMGDLPCVYHIVEARPMGARLS